MSEVIILLCSIVQVGSLAAIIEMIYHNRDKRYRGWIYLIAGFAPLLKMPFIEKFMFIDLMAFVAGIGLLITGMMLLFAANAEDQYLTAEPAQADDGSDRIIHLD
jgi:predicted membrane channel-forming protein YqfA (hemolysin III family)